MNNIDNKNDKSLFKKDNISLNELKALSLSTPNDAELGGKIRQMLWEKDDVLITANKDVLEGGSIFGKISGSQYKELIEGYQNNTGEEFNKWYSELNNEEKVFLSSLFD
jgi:hypothetical protein